MAQRHREEAKAAVIVLGMGMESMVARKAWKGLERRWEET